MALHSKYLNQIILARQFEKNAVAEIEGFLRTFYPTIQSLEKFAPQMGI